MVTMSVIHGLPIYKSENCMSFATKMIELSNIYYLKRPYYRYSIKDIDELLEPYLFYEGQLERKEVLHPEYMEVLPKWTNFKEGIGLISCLLYRMVTKFNNIPKKVNAYEPMDMNYNAQDKNTLPYFNDEL